MSDALRRRLSILLDHAEQNPGAESWRQPVSVVTRLPKIGGANSHNLRVDIVFTAKKLGAAQSSTTSLFISRAASEPTQADWKSIIHSWPYPEHVLMPKVEPRRRQENGRVFLCAQFPTQPRLILCNHPTHTPAGPRSA